MRESLDARIKIAEEIADDDDAAPGERLKALDLLARYGLGTTITETDTEGRDKPKVIEVPAKQPTEVWSRLHAGNGSNGHSR